MQDNSDNTGTFSNAEGLSDSDAEKLLAAVYNGEDVSKFTSSAPEEPQEKQETEPEQKQEAQADPVQNGAETPDKEVKGNNQEQSQDKSNPYAWVESISDADMKAKVSQMLAERLDLEHRWKSDNGRLRSAAQVANQLRQELDKIKKPPQEEKKEPSAAESSVDIPEDPEWRKIVESDSVLAKAIEKRAQQIVEARLNKLAPDLAKQAEERARAAVAPYEAQQRQQEYESDLHRLRSEVPNLDQVVGSQQYRDWLTYYATPEIQKMAAEGDTYTKAITVLKHFDYDMRMRMSNFQPQHTQVSADEQAKADKLAKEREEKLNRSAPPGNQRQPVPAGDAKKNTISTLEEQEKIFNAQWNK